MPKPCPYTAFLDPEYFPEGWVNNNNLNTLLRKDYSSEQSNSFYNQILPYYTNTINISINKLGTAEAPTGVEGVICVNPVTRE